MSIINKKLQIAIAFIVSLFMSCEHKELCYDHSHTVKVRVIFKWNKALNASPETMRLYLFPENKGKPLSFEFTDYGGGYINVPAGRYKGICLNSDTESVLYRNIESFDEFEAYAPDGVLSVGAFLAPPSRDASQERMAKSPDMLYSAFLEDVVIEFSKQDPTIILYPDLSVCRYRVVITNVSNLKHVSSDGLSGALSGMSGGLMLGHQKLTPAAVTVPFKVGTNGTSMLVADFLTFGQHGSSGPEHKLTIYVVVSDGNKYSYIYDVSRLVYEAPNPRDVYIQLDGLSLPEPITNGNGFHPSIDDWQNIHVEVPM